MQKLQPIPNKDLIVYLESRVLVWRIFPWIEKIAADVVDFLNDWKILKPKVGRVDKRIIEYLKQSILPTLVIFQKLCKKHHLKGLIVYQDSPSLSLWSQWFENPSRLLLRIKKIIKGQQSSFLELRTSSRDFQKTQGRFGKFALGVVWGEEQEKLNSKIIEKFPA